MGRQLVYFMVVLMVLGLATSGSAADLAHRWSFNGDLVDSVGGQDAVIVDDGSNDAILSDSEITLTGGAKGSSDYIDLADGIVSSLGDTVTFEAWATQISVQNWSRIFDFGTSTAHNVVRSWTNATALGTDRVEWLGPDGSSTVDSTNAPYELGVEYHIVCIFEPGSVTWYTAPADAPDLGEAKGSFETNNVLSDLADDNVWLGQSQWPDATANASWNEVRFWVGALTPEELEKMHDLGPDGLAVGIAFNPSPADEATDVPRDSILSWSPSETAATHDVYLGTSFDDVNAATTDAPLGVLISEGQTGTTLDPGRLELGQTYYWRVDEVNAAPDFTVFKGEIWSFTVEPFAYAIENIVVTTDGVSDPGMLLESMVNGSGLNEADQHSTLPEDMWVGTPLPGQPLTLQFDFDAAYKLHEMQVWNYNVMFELMLGFGLKDVTVEYSENGTDWMLLGDVQFAQATAKATYTANTIIDFSGVPAKAVRLTVNSGYGMLGKLGLSEVRFLQIPVQAREPEPAVGATDVDVDATFDWRVGREAASHEVYLSTDEQAVIDGTAGAITVAQPPYSATLDLSETYYWKVVEVNEAEAISAWEGAIWNFATADFIVIDDFESYTDDEGSRIYETWADGWVNDTGATVGYLEEPFAEQTIVLSGEQSMPLAYANVGGVSISRADLTFSVPQDWTRAASATLVLNFHGDLENDAAQVYVEVNGTKVVYDGAAEGITASVWKQWNIDLASVGANLQSVTTLSVGVEGAGSGLVYVDDIRLYRFAPAVVAPADPGTGDLVAHYAFEDNVIDDTGNGYDGTEMNDPFYDDAVANLGRAMRFDGINDYVELPIGSLLAGLDDITVALWADFPNTTGSWQRIFDFGNSSSAGYMFLSPRTGTTGPLRFAITPTAGAGESIVEASDTLPSGWHHVAVTIDSASMTMALYLDGSVVAEGETATLPSDLGQTAQNSLGRSQYDADAYYNGLLADFSIYTRALSEGEIRYLAGDR
ncbi:MAG: LamG domain-containing protein [Phycisphaerales bacterium]|nr:MAG: LamG domain-containing protein [Phycisphaerales bacterium]